MRVFEMVLKDLKVFFSDKKALGIMILMPVILTTILGFALKSAFIVDENTYKTRIGVVREYNQEEDLQKFKSVLNNNLVLNNIDDKTKIKLFKGVEGLSIEEIFFKEFLESKELQKYVEYQIFDREEALNKLNKGEISAVVVLPKEFVFDMYVNFLTPFRNKVEIEVLAHPERNLAGQIIEDIMNAFRVYQYYRAKTYFQL